MKGCGEYFMHKIGEFKCDGKLYVNCKKKFCPKYSKNIHKEKTPASSDVNAGTVQKESSK